MYSTTFLDYVLMSAAGHLLPIQEHLGRGSPRQPDGTVLIIKPNTASEVYPGMEEGNWI